MNVELISIVAVGVALAGVILASSRGLRQDMARMESRLDEKISGLESRTDEKISGLESRLDGKISGLESQINDLRGEVGELRERMAKLEGLLEGLREAITGRAAAS